ncbi:MAG: hypothetical protein ACRDJJ_03605 [Actinomycetota bacterium]
MATPPETVDTQALEGRNRNVQVAVVAALLIAALVVVWFAFLSGGDAEETSQPTSPPAGAANPEPDEKAAAPRGKKGPVETFEVFAPKDPFDPLVSEGGGGGTTEGTTGGSTGGSNTGAAGGPAPALAGESVGGHTVRLVDVFTAGGRQRAQVQVDGTVYTVDEGETFAESFKLMSVSGECASMLFGDDQFSICEGEELLK